MVVAAACGGSPASASATKSSSPAKSSSSAKSSSHSSSVASFRTCLAKHGLKLRGGPGSFPSGGSPPSGGSSPPSSFAGPGGPGFAGGSGNSKFAKAFRACRSKLPAGARRFPSGHHFDFTASPQFKAAFDKYATCMDSHGVHVPDSFQQAEKTVKRSTAAFKAANTACAHYLTALRARPPAPTTTTTG